MMSTTFTTRWKIVVVISCVVGIATIGSMLTYGLNPTHMPELHPQEPAHKPEVARKGEDKPITVKAVKPKAGWLRLSVTEPATVRPNWKAGLLPPVTGTVADMKVDVGDRVKKGQLLAVIDAPQLVSQTKKAVRELEWAKSLVVEAEARIAISEAELKAAKELLAAREETVKKGILSELDLVRARSEVAIQASKVRFGQAALQSAEANVAKAQIELENARNAESYTRVCAPFDGMVTRRNADPGFFVDPNNARESQPLIVLETLDRVKIAVRVREKYISFIQVGDAVDFEITTQPGFRMKDLKVARFISSIDPKDGSFLVEIDVTKPKDQAKRKIPLFPGMSGSATIHLRNMPIADTLLVPRSCLEGIDGEFSLYVIRDGKAHRQRVIVEINDGSNAEVSEGITASDLVIIDGQRALKEGTPVKIETEP